MKLQVLIDRNTYIDQYLLGEPALSFYIEDAGKKILFDVGYSDAFIQTANDLQIMDAISGCYEEYKILKKK